MSFFAELKRRNVFKVGVAYAIVGWLLLQAASILFPTFHAPDWVMQVFTIIIMLGFPIALILAWAFELTPEGIKITTPEGPDQYHTRTTGQQLNYVIIGVLVLVVAFLLMKVYVMKVPPEVTGQTPVTAAMAKTTSPAKRIEGKTEPVVPSNSIAVLPFVDMSPDKNQGYFADGIAEQLLDQLAKIRGLEVAGRTSSFYFKGRHESFQTIGEKLGVANILEGSVRKEGNKVRITTQLIKAADGYHLWSETYDRTMDDIFTIQDEIAKAVANALQITLGVGELGRIPGMTRNVEAYENFLAGRSLFNKLNRDNISQAMERLEQAVALDPKFAVAWATLIPVYNNAGAIFYPERAKEYFAKASAARARVLALVPKADYALRIKAQQSGDWVETERLLQQALALNPEDVSTNFAYGGFLDNVGRPTEAIEYLQRAVRREPLDAPTHIWLGLTYEYMGNPAASAVAFKQLGEISNDPTISSTTLLVLALEANNRARIDEYLAKDSWVRKYLDNPAGIETEIRQRLKDPAITNNPYARQALAVWAAYFGKYELALEIWQGLPGRGIPHVFWRPIMKPMRRLPGFKDLVTKIGLAKYWRTTGNWGEFCHPVGKNDFECN